MVWTVAAFDLGFYPRVRKGRAPPSFLLNAGVHRAREMLLGEGSQGPSCHNLLAAPFLAEETVRSCPLTKPVLPAQE